MAAFNFMLSGSDEEILNAMRMADDIATEANSTVSDHTCDEASGLIDGYRNFGPVSVVVSDSSEDSGCPKLQEFSKTLSDEKNLFHWDSEYEGLLQSLSSLNFMCDRTIEQNRKMETDCNDFMRSNVEGAKQVLSVSLLNKELEEINTVNSHILAIFERISAFKEALGNIMPENTFKANPSCQKYVIQFFHLANDLVENLEKNLGCIEACLKNGFDNWSAIRGQVGFVAYKIQEEMVRRLDAMAECRSNLRVLAEAAMKCGYETVSDMELSCVNPQPDSVKEVIYDSS